MKTFIKFIILLVIINIVCWYLLPFMVYLTECMIRDAPFIWLTMSTLLVIIGIISFIYSYINGKSKNNSTVVIATAIALAVSGIVFSFIRTQQRFINGLEYHEGYILIEDKSHNKGLADKFGMTFIETKYDMITKVFNEELQSYHFICIIKSDLDYNDKIYNNFIIHKYNKQGELTNTKTISESDCDNITDYVEKYIGAIITKYDWYDEPMRHSSKEETVLQDVSSTEYSKDSELSEHKNERYNEYDSKPKNKHNSSSSSYTPEYGTRDIWVNCINCNGSGYCPSCHGKGQCVSTWSDGSYNDTYQCPVCMGSGRCQQCYGTRGHYEKQIYQIK